MRISRYFALLMALVAADAAAQTWSGGAGNNWSNGANWSGGVAPPSSATTVVTFGLAGSMTPVVDAPWTINRLDFLTGGYTFSGQTLTFSGADPAITRPISASVQPNTFANPVVATGSLQVANFGFLDFTGGISATGPVTFSGLGFASIAGSNVFAGGLTVAPAQVLQLRGGSIQGQVTVANAGVFTGGGTIAGPVTMNGPFLSGGGTLAPTPAYGTLRTGDLTVDGSLHITINGTAQGTQFGHVDVTGTVSLGTPRLPLSGPFVPPEGTVFTIITNDGSDPVSGTFLSLPEGATVTFNGVPLRISYVGGTGNDVTLSAVGPPVASAQVPTLSNLALLLLAALLAMVGAPRLRRGSNPRGRIQWTIARARSRSEDT